MRLSLLSWNLHGAPGAARIRQRFRRVAEWIRASQRPPDLLLLQEVWRPGERRLLAEALAPEWRAVAPEGRRRPVLATGLLAFVRIASGIVLRDSDTLFFAAAAPSWRLWEGDGIGRKGALCLHLDTPAGPLAAIVTHLQAQYPARSYRDLRRAQLGELLDFADSLPPEIPLLAAGDLNTWPEELEAFLGPGTAWRDLSREERVRSGGGTCFTRTGGDEWIDYLLERDAPGRRLELLTLARVINRAPDDPWSDHHGLYAELELS